MDKTPSWNENYQVYFEKLNTIIEKNMGDKSADISWDSIMNSWNPKLSTESLNIELQQILEKMHAQGKIFFQLGDNFAKKFSSTEDWSKILDKTFEQIQQKNKFNTQDIEQQFKSFWQSPQQSWQKIVDEMQLPFKNKNNGENNHYEQLFAMPGCSYDSEDEANNKLLMQAIIAYQQAFLAYSHFFADFSQATMTTMKQKVKNLLGEDKSINSLHDLYNLWVNACEEVYAGYVTSSEYAKLHGDMVNSLMKVKQCWGKIIDKRLKLMNIPTQQQINSLQDRLQESRREVKTLRSEMNQMEERMQLMFKTIKKISKYTGFTRL
ncbi:MAG: DUF2730 family protein [Pseudomonadota bacterium]